MTKSNYRAESWTPAQNEAAKIGLPIEFVAADVLNLPFADRTFDFVFSNGVLHHTRSWRAGLAEYGRVMKHSGYLYLYGSGGLFWQTRAVLRQMFKAIPRDYAAAVLAMIGMPPNRFIFMDNWYVPIEDHVVGAELAAELAARGLDHRPLPSLVPSDPGAGLGLPNGTLVWGEGEHRYLVFR